MKLTRAIVVAVLLVGAFVLLRRPAPAEPPQTGSSAAVASPQQTALADSMDKKLARIQENGAKANPDQAPTVLTEDEVNAWFAAGRAKLPAGVKRVQFHGSNGVVTSNSRVDFDQLTASRRSSNPLLGLFTGVHDVQVVAHARAEGGTGIVDVDSAAIDGTEVPRMVLQLFVDKYLAPRYPGLGMNSRFKMPSRVDTATVGDRQVTITQK